jgi:hypothetical protein
VTNCTEDVLQLPACQRRVVEAAFSGGLVTRDAGALLLREVD